MRSLAIVLLLAVSARAEPRNAALVDIAGEIGGGTDGFVLGLRPELVLTHYADIDLDRGDGIGIAGELVRAGGHGLLGGSLEYVHLHHVLRIEPSLGAYDRLADGKLGVTASLLVALRAGEESPPWQAHVGLRLTGRVDGDESAIELTAQLDPVFLERFVTAFGLALAPH
jgi:hypothetical protein